MIYLTNGTTSVVTITPYEKTNQVQPYYTWQIIRKGTFEEVVFFQTDSSYAPWYWSSFTISVGTISGLTQGQIVANPGEWTYNIWEMTTPYNLSYTQSIGLVESGILIISGTSTADTEYSGNDDAQIVYYKNI
jgi:hypothetical protein